MVGVKNLGRKLGMKQRELESRVRVFGIIVMLLVLLMVLDVEGVVEWASLRESEKLRESFEIKKK